MICGCGVLGSSDPEGAEIYAETVTLGDPHLRRSLAGSRWDSMFISCS